jgi:hypothetical protein
MISGPKPFEKEWLSAFVCVLVLAIFACAMVANLSTGTPADLGSLGTQPQKLIWKNEQVAIFRGLEGGMEKFVKLDFFHDAPLEVGATFLVKDHPVMSRMGWLHFFWLKRI